MGTGWNRGFFSGDESMGEPSRVVSDVILEGDENNIKSNGGGEVYGNNTEESAHSLLHNIDEENLSKDTGWNHGFFNGDEAMAEKERLNWTYHQDVGNDLSVDKDLKSGIDGSKWDKEIEDQDNQYKDGQVRMEKESSELRNSLIFSGEELSNFSGKTREFVDSDNYDRFLNIKQGSDWLSIYVEVFFIVIYTILLVILFVMKYILQFENDIISPLLSLMVIPVIIITLYKSLNSYSFIKILL